METPTESSHLGLLWALQFGHDLSAVETLHTKALEPHQMMPLQFGHDLSAVETILDEKHANWPVRLQFGHDLSAVETLFAFAVTVPL